MISLLKCWNERPHSRAEHFGRDLGKRIASQPLQIAAPKCPVSDLAFRHILLSQMGDQIPAGFLQPREAAEFQFY